jgi:hypothetical protein
MKFPPPCSSCEIPEVSNRQPADNILSLTTRDNMDNEINRANSIHENLILTNSQYRSQFLTLVKSFCPDGCVAACDDEEHSDSPAQKDNLIENAVTDGVLNNAWLMSSSMAALEDPLQRRHVANDHVFATTNPLQYWHTRLFRLVKLNEPLPEVTRFPVDTHQSMVKALVKSTANFMLFGNFDLANEDIHCFIPRDVIENAFPRGST